MNKLEKGNFILIKPADGLSRRALKQIARYAVFSAPERDIFIIKNRTELTRVSSEELRHIKKNKDLRRALLKGIAEDMSAAEEVIIFSPLQKLTRNRARIDPIVSEIPVNLFKEYINSSDLDLERFKDLG